MNRNIKAMPFPLKRTNKFTVWQQQYKNFSYEYVSLNEAEESVMVIAVSKNNDIILIKKYCPPTSRFEITLPGGKLKKSESAKEALIREMTEELNLKPKNFKKIASLNILPQYLVGKTHIYIASEFVKNNDFDKEKGELIQTVQLPLKKVMQMIMRGKVSDTRTVAGILLYEKFFVR